MSSSRRDVQRLLRSMSQEELRQNKYKEVVDLIETNKRNPSKQIDIRKRNK